MVEHDHESRAPIRRMTAVVGLGLLIAGTIWLWLPHFGVTVSPARRGPISHAGGNSAENGELARDPGTDSQPFSELQQAAVRSATVRLSSSTGAGVGLGAIVGRDAGFTYILSASHVVPDSDNITLQHGLPGIDGWSKRVDYPLRVVARDARADLVLLRVAPPLAEHSRLRIAPLSPEQRRTRLLAVGIANGAKCPACVSRMVAGPQNVRRPGRSASVMWEAKEDIQPGDSGGPLVDPEGRLIGIASGKSEDRAYFTHHREVREFLTRHTLDWVLEGDDERLPAETSNEGRPQSTD